MRGTGSDTRPALLVLLLLIVSAPPGCASRTLSFPTGPGVPLDNAPAMFADVSRACRGVSTLTAELSLSGRAAGDRLRGRVVAGFAPDGAMRLEAVAPFGAPAFTLVSSHGTATLLTRDGGLLRGEAPDRVLEALTGVPFGPGDLQAILTGCVVPDGEVASGAGYGGARALLHLEGGAAILVERDGDTWRTRAAERDGWRVEYPVWTGTFPARIELRSRRVALSLELSQIEANAAIDARAFDVTVPVRATPLTLDDLRQAGPLRDET